MRSMAIAVLVLGLLAGCRKSGEPSKDYEEARAQYNQLYGRMMEDAYTTPEMAQIESQLERVPKESSDHVLAQELLKQIRSGRERVEARRADTDRALKEATAPAQDFEFSERPAAPGDAGVAEKPDAGAAEPVPGMPLLELTRRWGDCFLPGKPIEIEGKGERPTYLLRDTAYCAQHHPGFDKKVVFIENDKVLLVGDKAQLEIVTVDAGVPPAPPPQAPSAGPEDAG